MKPLARSACASALLAFALVANAAPVCAQEEPPAESSAVAPPERASQTTERAGGRRVVRRPGVLSESPTLTRSERRVMARVLQGMTPRERDRFLRDWERKSSLEKRAFIREQRERRSAQELPARLRTPEMRERLEGMTLEERRRFFRHVRQWRDLKPAERSELRARLERFGALDEAAQRALIEKKFGARSGEAREKILRDLQDAARRLREREREASGAPKDE